MFFRRINLLQLEDYRNDILCADNIRRLAALQQRQRVIHAIARVVRARSIFDARVIARRVRNGPHLL